MAVAEEKAGWRAALLAGRRARPDSARTSARAAIRSQLAGRWAAGTLVCGFLPLPTEPFDPAVLEDLVANDVRVLVPVATAGSPLDWVRYPCPVEAGPFGIARPIGPLLGAGSIVQAGAVLVPALAVDRSGVRLGRGGGHYDRSLALAPEVPTVAVLFDDELVPVLPAESFDRPVRAVVTPSGGIALVGH